MLGQSSITQFSIKKGVGYAKPQSTYKAKATSLKKLQQATIAEQRAKLKFLNEIALKLEIGNVVKIQDSKRSRKNGVESCVVTDVHRVEGTIVSFDCKTLLGRQRKLKFVDVDRIVNPETKRTYKSALTEKPPTPDKTFLEWTKGDPQWMHEVLGHSPTLRSNEVFRRYKKMTPSWIMDLIMDGLKIRCKVPWVAVVDNFFEGPVLHTVKHIPEDKPFMVDIDFGNIEDTLLPNGRPTSAERKKKIKPYPVREFDGKQKSLGGLLCYLPDKSRRHVYLHSTLDQEYLRLGDYIRYNRIIEAIKICCNGSFYNLATILLINCQLVIRLDEMLSQSALSRWFPHDLVETLCGFFTHTHLAYIKHEPANHHPLRAGWRGWNVFDDRFDVIFRPDWQIFRLNCRSQFPKDRKIAGEKLKHAMKNLVTFNYMVIMLFSQAIMDERCEKQYYQVIAGRHDALSFIHPLSHVPYTHLLNYYKKLYSSFSLPQLKAHSLLYFMITLHVMEGGVIPQNTRKLLAFRQVGQKKSRVSMNAVGIYMGIGVDRHVQRIFKIICDDYNNKHNNVLTTDADGVSKNFIADLAGVIREDVGFSVNDEVGEISQQYIRGNSSKNAAKRKKGEDAKTSGKRERDVAHNKCWAENVLSEIANKSEYNRAIIQQWKEDMKPNKKAKKNNAPATKRKKIQKKKTKPNKRLKKEFRENKKKTGEQNKQKRV